MARLLSLFMALALLGACGATQVDEAPEDLGAFKARVLHVFTDKALQWPLSRDADASEWTEPMKRALNARLGRYQGSQEFDVAVTLEGFMLAPGGVPILFSPKSVAVVNVFVYDVSGAVFLAEKIQMEIFEDTTGESALLGSGHSRSKQEQIDGLALNIADKIEEFIAKKHADEGWFAPKLAEPQAADPASDAG
ncbi:hypothetical protein KMP13_05790 [Epibacterium ulvae]|uniref:hypothetical protein n=1 Tax=Epibacterium ulvae TaxID=1156985 RepID=UPI001BFC8271|nr:hypothetical protein [Epibacterium ulvae]MBT8153412.1 hypothetical protein [Epibacterium ulvae]